MNNPFTVDAIVEQAHSGTIKIDTSSKMGAESDGVVLEFEKLKAKKELRRLVFGLAFAKLEEITFVLSSSAHQQTPIFSFSETAIRNKNLKNGPVFVIIINYFLKK